MLQKIHKEAISPVKLVPGERDSILGKIKQVMPDILQAIDRNMDCWQLRFPDAACRNGRYPIIDNVEWTTSFWSGQLWLAWEWSGDENTELWPKNTFSLLASASFIETTQTIMISVFCIVCRA